MTLARLREPAFARMFAATEQAEALSWGTAPWEFAASDEFRRILDVDEVEGWVDCSLLQYPFFKVLLDDEQVPVPLVASPRSVAGQPVMGMIDGAKFRDVFAQGGTLMLCNMHEWHAPSRELCRSLTGTLAAEVKATAFYSPPGCRGLATHRDDAHVFVAQLSGEKQWSLFDLPDDLQSRRIGRVDTAACGRETVVTLGAGDGLYLPPYLAHHARALPLSHSLHMSIHVREPRSRDVVNLAVDEVLTASRQRAEVSGDAAARAIQVADLLKLVAEGLAELDPIKVVEALERRVTGR